MKIILSSCYCFLFLLLLLECKPKAIKNAGLEKEGAVAAKGMVVSAHPLATKIGAKILKSGGNAYDAAVAVHFALAVCYPNAGNIGGGGFMVYRKGNGEIGSLDFRETAPSSSTKSMYLDSIGNEIRGLSFWGAKAVGVPGSVDGMAEIHKSLCSLPWKTLLQPSIDMAKQGVVLTEKEVNSLNRIKERLKENNAYIPFLVKDKPWVKGEAIEFLELAKVLTKISCSGRDGFYQGEVADLIVNEMSNGKGFITHEDLINYKSVWRTPVKGDYKGYNIISMPPPSSGGVALLQLLEICEKYDFESKGFHHPDVVHLMVESEKLVYADRSEFLGDPDFFEVPMEKLLDKNYLDKRRKHINLNKAVPSTSIRPGNLPGVESEQTTHFSIVDQWGNAASVTTTLNGSYGSAVVVKGGGFLLNNEMDDFSIKPGVPNAYGLTGGRANEIAPGKRMLSSMTPTIIEKEGSLFMVVGTPGGSTIITSVFQTILNVIDFGMPMQEAVTASRFHHQWLPDYIFVEEGAFSKDLSLRLQEKGHKIQERESIGRVDGILIRKDGTLEGGADPRGDDYAEGI